MQILILTLSIILIMNANAIHYQPNWPSLDSRPLPSWYDEAKVGIFMHLGPYAVPGLEDAWFWKNWKNNESSIVEFMEENYPPRFTYQDFGRQLKMEFFNASWIADLVKDSGAKYYVFTSKHHDGFTNWPSTYTFGWNSKDVGPKKDIVGELKAAFKRHPDIHFGLYYSLYEWFNPLYLKDKANQFKTRYYVLSKMLPELKELITRYKPDLLWSDGEWEATPEYFGSKDFLAWLYNDSPSKDTIVTNDRWGKGTRLKHGGFYSGPDKFNPGHLLQHKFEDATIVDKKSWGNRRNIRLEDIKETHELISELVSIISCNGNILINVGPTREGTIIPIFEERLRQLGGWLKINGEAIYGTKPWIHQKDSKALQPQVWYTSKKNTVYGIVLGWPIQSQLYLSDLKVSASTKIHLVGYHNPLKFLIQADNSIKIIFPPMDKFVSTCGKFCRWAYTLKVSNPLSHPNSINHLRVQN